MGFSGGGWAGGFVGGRRFGMMDVVHILRSVSGLGHGIEGTKWLRLWV